MANPSARCSHFTDCPGRLFTHRRTTTKPQLLALFAAAGIWPRDALRVKKSPAAELGLTDPSVADEDIVEAMVVHPILVEQPIVVTVRGTALCRPSEQVLDLLDRLPPSPFAKEDGELMIDAEGKRLI